MRKNLKIPKSVCFQMSSKSSDLVKLSFPTSPGEKIGIDQALFRLFCAFIPICIFSLSTDELPGLR